MNATKKIPDFPHVVARGEREREKSERKTKVRITWNGMGGELDSCTAIDDGEHALAEALIKMVRGGVVAPGDSFSVEEIA